MLKSLKGEETRIFGTFDGYSKAWSKPVITIAKGSPDHACRIESTDGDIVVTYLDSKWKDKEADTDYSLGDLSWKGISEWEADNSFDDTSDPVTGTVLYGPLSGYPATVYVHMNHFLRAWPDGTTAKLTVSIFIEDEATVVQGAAILKGRCFALPFMMIGYQVVNFMNAVDKGKLSFLLAIIRHIVLIIPIAVLMNSIMKLNGLVMSQLVADIINTVISMILFYVTMRSMDPAGEVPR